MHQMILETLSPLGIELAWGGYEGDASQYIIFSIYDEGETDSCDDVSLSEVYYITLSYWFKSPECLKNKEKIKKLMEASGFTFDGAKDLYDKGINGINIDFILEKEKEC